MINDHLHRKGPVFEARILYPECGTRGRLYAPFALLLTLFWTLAPVRALADPPVDNPVSSSSVSKANQARAEELIDKGIELMKDAKWPEALDLFVQSKRLVESEANTMNAAICLEKLERYAEALDMYQLVAARFASDLSTKNKENLVPAIGRLTPLVATITLDVNIGGYSVFVDGASRIDLANPNVLHVAPGHHVLRIVRNDFHARQVDIDVRAREERGVTIELEPIGAWLVIRDKDPALAGTTVYIDGEIAGVTPLFQQVPNQPKVVWVRAGDIGSVPIEVVPVERQMRRVELSSAPLGPEMKIEVEPAFGSLFIDRVKMPSPTFTGRLPMGRYVVRATAEGFRPSERTIEVTKTEPQEPIRIVLPKGPFRWDWLSAFAGLAFGPGLGSGAEESCAAHPCQNVVPPLGFLTGLRGAYHLSPSLALELSVGVFRVESTFDRQVAVKAYPGSTYFLHDELLAWGPFLTGGASYRGPLLPFADVVGRVGLGLLAVRSRDTISGTVQSSSGTVPLRFSGGESVTSPAAIVLPELGLARHVGRFDLAASLALGVVPAALGATLRNGQATAACPPGVSAPFCGASTLAWDKERAYDTFVLFIPTVSASYVWR